MNYNIAFSGFFILINLILINIYLNAFVKQKRENNRPNK